VPCPVHSRPDIKSDKEHNKTVNKLGDQGGSGSSQPYSFLAGHFFDLVEDKHVYELAQDKGGKRGDDNKPALAKDTVICLCHIRHTTPLFARNKEISRCEFHGAYKYKKGKPDQAGSQPGKELHSF